MSSPGGCRNELITQPVNSKMQLFAHFRRAAIWWVLRIYLGETMGLVTIIKTMGLVTIITRDGVTGNTPIWPEGRFFEKTRPWWNVKPGRLQLVRGIGTAQSTGTWIHRIWRNSDTSGAILLDLGWTPTTERRYWYETSSGGQKATGGGFQPRKTSSLAREYAMRYANAKG